MKTKFKSSCGGMAVRYTEKDAEKFVKAGAKVKNGSRSNKARN
tara:strand:+ start:104 stop:232 length:129 start_codon:yes stop_codon:yes gene_type:complete